VSYLQVGGWELFRRHTSGLSLPKMRIVCTDQMGITQPAAVERAIKSGVQIRNFCGNVVYHPKVYLAHDRNGRPTRFLLGSANLSISAFTTSVEAGVLSDEKGALDTLKSWFNGLFDHRTETFTPARLREMEVKWRLAAAQRAKGRLRTRRDLAALTGAPPVPVGPEDLDTIEDVFATIQLPIGLLNMDYARNNVRSIRKLREVLADPDAAHSKQQSELKLLGFMQHGTLTALGRTAAAAGTNEEVARLWCEWLQGTSDGALATINENLLVAKRVFRQFWKLKQEVRDYFLSHAVNPADRRTMQTIELLCNARDVVQELSFDDVRTLSTLLDHPSSLPPYIRAEVADYFDNKGTRTWRVPDRRTVPEAWKAATRP
jgi:PLD-like domain